MSVFFLVDLDTLDACYEDIQSNCTLQISESQLSKVDSCLDSANSLTEQIDNCLDQPSTNDSCSCFSNLNTTNLDNVKTCSLSEEMNLAISVKRNCTTGQSVNIELIIRKQSFFKRIFEM